MSMNVCRLLFISMDLYMLIVGELLGKVANEVIHPDDIHVTFKGMYDFFFSHLFCVKKFPIP